MISQKHQIKFYEEELEYQELEVKETFETSSENLFSSGRLFFARFLYFDSKRGAAHFELIQNINEDTPRLRSNYLCFVLKSNFKKKSFRRSHSYRDMINDLKAETDTSSSYIVDLYENKLSGKLCCIINDISTTFIESLIDNVLVSIGPDLPPWDYLMNLKSQSENFHEYREGVSKNLLSFDYTLSKENKPIVLSEKDDILNSIIDLLKQEDLVVFQGPPGCGKTYLMSQLIEKLINDGESVLFTALTNQALMEVCEKPCFDALLKNGCIRKAGISSSEKMKYNSLKLAKDVVPIKSTCLLSTYYKTSNQWDYINDDINFFDYVIIEEASQGFLTTIASTIALGKKAIVVGDPLQIQPIIKNNNKYRVSSNVDYLINGMETVCSIKEIPFIRKQETRRLLPRTTEYTNLFYNGTIVSLNNSLHVYLGFNSKLNAYIHPKGGPSLIKFDFKNYGKKVECCIPFLALSLLDLKSNKIAILSPFIETVNYLIKELRTIRGHKDVLIETIDRVQGLDVEYCFYVIPNDAYHFSLNRNKFNVATSRASIATFILADTNILSDMLAHESVSDYLNKLDNDWSFNYK